MTIVPLMSKIIKSLTSQHILLILSEKLISSKETQTHVSTKTNFLCIVIITYYYSLGLTVTLTLLLTRLIKIYSIVIGWWISDLNHWYILKISWNDSRNIISHNKVSTYTHKLQSFSIPLFIPNLKFPY